MLELPDEAFVTDCPYRVEKHDYYITLVFASGERWPFSVSSNLLTYSAIDNFVEDVFQYGQGTLVISRHWTIIYTADRPTLVTIDYRYWPHPIELPFCRELFDTLMDMAR